MCGRVHIAIYMYAHVEACCLCCIFILLHAASWAIYLPAICVLHVYIDLYVHGYMYVYMAMATAFCAGGAQLPGPVVVCLASLATYLPASYVYCWRFTAHAAPLSTQDAICSALGAVYLPAL